MSKESELLVYVLIDRKIDRYYVINLFISLSVGGSNNHGKHNITWREMYSPLMFDTCTSSSQCTLESKV